MVSFFHVENDVLGEKVCRNHVISHDFHATILHLLGLVPERLTYFHADRNYRLTDVHCQVVKPILT